MEPKLPPFCQNHQLVPLARCKTPLDHGVEEDIFAGRVREHLDGIRVLFPAGQHQVRRVALGQEFLNRLVVDVVGLGVALLPAHQFVGLYIDLWSVGLVEVAVTIPIPVAIPIPVTIPIPVAIPIPVTIPVAIAITIAVAVAESVGVAVTIPVAIAITIARFVDTEVVDAG